MSTLYLKSCNDKLCLNLNQTFLSVPYPLSGGNQASQELCLIHHGEPLHPFRASRLLVLLVLIEYLYLVNFRSLYDLDLRCPVFCRMVVLPHLPSTRRLYAWTQTNGVIGLPYRKSHCSLFFLYCMTANWIRSLDQPGKFSVNLTQMGSTF